MKKVLFVLITITIFLLISCGTDLDTSCPTVKPELLFVDSRSAIIGWDNVGKDYSYEAWCYTEKEGLWVSIDEKDTLITKEKFVVSVLSPPTKECVFEINELSPAKDYEVIVYTHSDSDNEKVHSNFIQFAFKTKDE